MENKCKSICLASGSEEGCVWQLQLAVCENTKNFAGHFVTHEKDSIEQQRRGRIRSSDNSWARRAFPRQWKAQFEIHHNWDDEGRVQLLTHLEHVKLHRNLKAKEVKKNEISNKNIVFE